MKIKDLTKIDQMQILKRQCAVCGKKVTIRVEVDKSYTGGHYFGKVPIYSKKEMDKAMRLGSRRTETCGRVINVLKYDLKQCGHEEYWECDSCFIGDKK